MFSWLLQIRADNPNASPSSKAPSLEDCPSPMLDAMPAEDFYQQINEMRVFIELVLKIAFNHFHHHQEDPEAKHLYDSFFPPRKRNNGATRPLTVGIHLREPRVPPLHLLTNLNLE